MKNIFQIDTIKTFVKNLIKLAIKFVDYIMEPPAGYVEYKNAIKSKDKDFNYMENEYFKRYVLPFMMNKNELTPQNVYSSIGQQQSFGFTFSSDISRVNPSTGLTMIGSYDSGGNSFGFNHHSINNHMNNHSNFTNIHSMHNPFKH